MKNVMEPDASPPLAVPGASLSSPAAVGLPSSGPRDFLNNRYVYVVMSPRARGLCVGVNLNPDRHCNFDCVYCDVKRPVGDLPAGELNLEQLVAELDATLHQVHAGDLRRKFAGLPEELLHLRQVTLSGDGEPTLCPVFKEALERIIHVRAVAGLGFFKLVLLTNGLNLNAPSVLEGLELLTTQDEVWAKLDGGTQAYLERINRAPGCLQKVMANLVLAGRRRDLVIQSMFPAVHGVGPTPAEIEAYAARLNELKDKGVQIPLVQIYSATRPAAELGISHLPLRTLSEIARTVRRLTGLRAEIY